MAEGTTSHESLNGRAYWDGGRGVGAKETTGRELNIFMHENGAAIDTHTHTH